MNLFKAGIYSTRRKKLKQDMQSGIILLPGNDLLPMNYFSNTYRFRQDSTFLYFFGLDLPRLIGIIDIDENREYLFGNDINLNDVIWTGVQPCLKELAHRVGIQHTDSLSQAEKYIHEALNKKREIHFLPPYRDERRIQLHNLLGIPVDEIEKHVSIKLIQKVIWQRSVKDNYEIDEIERTLSEVTYDMHVSAMKMAREGVHEKHIAGYIEGIALQKGYMAAYPIILSMHGEVLHNHSQNNVLKRGRMMLVDAGAESLMHYATDITRTVPVNGEFSDKQKEIYRIVLDAEEEAIHNIQAGVKYRDVHIASALTIARGLKDLGLMKNNVEDAVNQGAHALFFPHGIGHMMGLDVHDMEDLGEEYVGYNDKNKRSNQFGLAYLRVSKELEEGYVITVEPGIYFIPALIDLWGKEKKFTEFINYNNVKKYRNFGGIRIEDNVLVNNKGCKILGKKIPKTIKEVEELCLNSK